MSQEIPYSLAITPLSPVHMGTDADYEPTGYVIDNGTLFEFDGIAALDVLPDVERKELHRILSGKPTDKMLREVQAFFHANRERLIACSRRQVRVNKSVEAFYRKRIGKVAQHEHGGHKVQNKLAIERTAWNPVSGQPILPGSGLKGTIRTALLDSINGGAELPKVEDRRTGRRRDENNGELQNRLFGFRSGKFELDPMRLIRVGDASLADDCQMPTEIYFALNRKKHPVKKDGVLVQSMAEQQGLYQLLECLPLHYPRAFAGTLAIQKLGGVGNVRNTPRRRFTIEDVASACNRFYRAILDHELQLLHDRGFIHMEWLTEIRQLMERLQPAFDGNRAFLLRVGRHSGAESVTLNGVRNIKIKQGQGKQTEDRSSKTLWLAGHERQLQRDLLPFGWVLVEINPEAGVGPWKGIAQPERDRAWRQAVQERIEILRHGIERQRAERDTQEQRAKAERQRREAEEAARRQAEEEEKRRRQAAFDALSDNEKRLHRFQDELRTITATPPLNKNDYAAFMGMINKLADEARQWTQPDRAKAADVIEAAFERFGWAPSGLRADRRKKQEKKRRALVTDLRTQEES